MVSSTRAKKPKSEAKTEKVEVNLEVGKSAYPVKITKVKISLKDASSIRYEQASPTGETDVVERPFYGAIHPDFEYALNALIPTVILWVGLDEETWEIRGEDSPVRVSGVSIRHEGALMGVTITAQRKMVDSDSQGVVVVNTPYLSPEVLDPSEQRILRDICEEAIARLNGKQAQLDLFSQEQP